MGQQRTVGLAHAAVAEHPRQRRHGSDQLQRIAGGGRARLQTGADGMHRRFQVGQQRLIDQRRQRGQRFQRLALLGDAGGGGVGHGGAVAAGLDQLDGQLGLPAQHPGLAEGAPAAPATAQPPPGNAQQAQAVQQVAAGQVGGVAQVEFERALQRLGFEAQAFLLLLQVALQGHGGHIGRHLAQALAHRQGAVDELQRRGIAHEHGGAHRFVHVVQARRAVAAHGGQRVRQPDGLDDVGRRAVDLVRAQQPRHPRQPARGPVGLGRQVPQKVVPAGCGDARAVAAGAGEVAIRPRHPGGTDLEPGQPFEQGHIGLGQGLVGLVCRLLGSQVGGQPGFLGLVGFGPLLVAGLCVDLGGNEGRHGGGLQCRYVPGTAHHGNAPVPGFLGLAHALAHVGLAQGFFGPAFFAVAPVGMGPGVAQHGHGLGDGLEQRQPVAIGAAFFHQVVPPAFAIGKPGGFGQGIQRVDVGGQCAVVIGGFGFRGNFGLFSRLY